MYWSKWIDIFDWWGDAELQKIVKKKLQIIQCKILINKVSIHPRIFPKPAKIIIIEHLIGNITGYIIRIKDITELIKKL